MAKSRKSDPYSTITLNEKLYRECGAMLSHASSNGKKLSPTLTVLYDRLSHRAGNLQPLKMRHRDFLSMSSCDFREDDVADLARLHGQLTTAVAPAKPFTLLLLQTDAENHKGQRFGSVPLVRRMLRAGIISMVLLVFFALFPQVSANTNEQLFDSKGFDLILNLGFLLSAAGMGASFYAIFKARDYVSNYTFDPGYESTYWAEFVLGLVAGVILGGFLPQTLTLENGMDVGKVTLALLGGFASNAVYEILNRLVGALTYLVKPEGKQLIKAEIKEAKAVVKEELLERKQVIADHLSDLQSDIFSGDFSKDELGGRVKEMLKDLVSGEYETRTTYRPTAKTTTNSNTGTVPSNTDDRPPIQVPPTNEPPLRADDVNPYMVEHYHEDEVNNADDEEYANI